MPLIGPGSPSAQRNLAARAVQEQHEEVYGALTLEEALDQLIVAQDKQAKAKDFQEARSDLIAGYSRALTNAMDQFVEEPTMPNQKIVAGLEDKLQAARDGLTISENADKQLAKHIQSLKARIKLLESKREAEEKLARRPVMLKRKQELIEQMRISVRELMQIVEEVDGIHPSALSLETILKTRGIANELMSGKKP